MGEWRCGDCHRTYPKTVRYCTRPFDDRLAVTGGSIENAIHRAVDRRIAPLLARAEKRLYWIGYPSWLAIAG